MSTEPDPAHLLASFHRLAPSSSSGPAPISPHLQPPSPLLPLQPLQPLQSVSSGISMQPFMHASALNSGQPLSGAQRRYAPNSASLMPTSYGNLSPAYNLPSLSPLIQMQSPHMHAMQPVLNSGQPYGQSPSWQQMMTTSPNFLNMSAGLRLPYPMASSATLAVPSIAAPSMLAHNYPQNAPRLAAATDAASQQRERRTLKKRQPPSQQQQFASHCPYCQQLFAYEQGQSSVRCPHCRAVVELNVYHGAVTQGADPKLDRHKRRPQQLHTNHTHSDGFGLASPLVATAATPHPQPAHQSDSEDSGDDAEEEARADEPMEEDDDVVTPGEQACYDLLDSFKEMFERPSSALVWLCRAPATRSYKFAVPKAFRWPKAAAGQGGYAVAFRKLGLVLKEADTKSGHWHYWHLDTERTRYRDLQRALMRRWKESSNFELHQQQLMNLEQTGALHNIDSVNLLNSNLLNQGNLGAVLSSLNNGSVLNQTSGVNGSSASSLLQLAQALQQQNAQPQLSALASTSLHSGNSSVSSADAASNQQSAQLDQVAAQLIMQLRNTPESQLSPLERALMCEVAKQTDGTLTQTASLLLVALVQQRQQQQQQLQSQFAQLLQMHVLKQQPNGQSSTTPSSVADSVAFQQQHLQQAMASFHLGPNNVSSSSTLSPHSTHSNTSDQTHAPPNVSFSSNGSVGSTTDSISPNTSGSNSAQPQSQSAVVSQIVSAIAAGQPNAQPAMQPAASTHSSSHSEQSESPSGPPTQSKPPQPSVNVAASALAALAGNAQQLLQAQQLMQLVSLNQQIINSNEPWRCPDCGRANVPKYAKGRCQACYRRNVNRPQKQMKDQQAAQAPKPM